MNKYELLKIYSAYLPYGLQIEFKRNIYPTSVEVQTLDLKNLCSALYPGRPKSFQIKPILYDLSYLTKEVEHEGVKVIPIDCISLSKANSQRIMRRYANGQSLDVLEQWQFERLLRLHINVFNLPES